jgi:pseudaminic acid cytidylyltransferase
MKFLAVIPARGGSKRIPKKNIIPFHGAPIISYTLRTAISSGLFEMVHVSTDDDEVRSVCASFGADVTLPRPKELSDDHTGLLPVVRWVLQQLAGQGRIFDAVFILFSCAPFLTVRDLRGAAAVFESHGGARNLLTIARAPTPAEWLYRRDVDGRLIPLQPGGAFIRSQDLAPAYYETGTFTIFSTNFLLNADCIEDDTNYVGFELPIWKALDIDEESDLEEARARFAIRRELIEAENAV